MVNSRNPKYKRDPGYTKHPRKGFRGRYIKVKGYTRKLPKKRR